MTSTKRIVLLAVTATAALTACTATVVRKPEAMPTGTRVSTPRYGATALVQRGDTLYGIAFRNGIDVRDLAEWNGLSPPYTIYPGQNLRLYPRNGPAAAAPRTASTPTLSEATPASKPVAAAPAPATPATAPPLPAPVAPVSDIRWRWPADGALASRYVAGEPTKQGVDITGSSGTPVRAAADGVVVYSGSGLVGYGELVIVKHNDAWLSAYGHNRARMVNEGAIVKAGQQIAVMGRTGAPRDMLHFEIRYNGKPVDPLTYLPKR